MSRPAAFIDRDWTLTGDRAALEGHSPSEGEGPEGYVTSPERLYLLPGSARAVRLLNAAGVLAIVVTNQSAVARGYMREEDLEAVHRRLHELLAAEGAHLDDILYCPHFAEGVVPRYAVTCRCRKPEPGLILEAARRHHIDLARSVMIGDAETDVEAGRRAGCRTVLVRPAPAARESTCADHVADDLLAAVRWFLSLIPCLGDEQPAP